MTFDPAKVPGGDVAHWGAQCRVKALAGLDAGNWRPVYDWTKSWIGWGGGAWLPDTWLLCAASALLKGQPRTAIHSIGPWHWDLAGRRRRPGTVDLVSRDHRDGPPSRSQDRADRPRGL